MRGRRPIDGLCGRGGTAVVLGSGLRCAPPAGRVAASIPYGEIAGMPRPTVEGHAGRLTAIDTRSGPLYLLEGRIHFYEEGDAAEAGAAAALAAMLGARRLLLTHAAGSLHRSLEPGTWIAATDIVSFPWRGCGGRGGRPPLLDPRLRERVAAAAAAAGVPLREGTLYWTAGPAYETPAEAAAASQAGALAATMSPLPELAAAREAGIPAASLALVTNWAPNVPGEPTGHGAVVAAGAAGASELSRIVASLAARGRRTAGGGKKKSL